MLRIQTQKNKDSARSSPTHYHHHQSQRHHHTSHQQPHQNQCQYQQPNNMDHSQSISYGTSTSYNQQPSSPSSPHYSPLSSPTTPRNRRQQRRISATFGGPGSVTGGGGGSGSESPSSYSTATPSPTSSRRLSPLLESSSAVFSPAGDVGGAAGLHSPPPSSSSSPLTLPTPTTEPYYHTIEGPMHPFDSLPSSSSTRAHKINTFGIGPVFGPFPASPTTYQAEEGEHEEEGKVAGTIGLNLSWDDCGSGNGGVSRRKGGGGGGGRGSTSTSQESSPYLRPTGGRARSTFGYDDHPISPISPLALSMVPSPTESTTPPSSRQQKQQQQRQQLEHAPLPPLPLSSSVHPPRIITTALHIPHPASAISSRTATTAPSMSPSVYSHYTSSPSPSSPLSALSSPPTSASPFTAAAAVTADRGGSSSNSSNHNNSTARERNLLFPSIGRLLGGDDRKVGPVEKKNAISPSLSPSPTSLPRPLSPHSSSHSSTPFLPTTGGAGAESAYLQIDHLHYYQQGVGRRSRSNSARSHVLSFDNDNDDQEDDRFTTITTATTIENGLTSKPSISSSSSRSRKRLSAFARKIFTSSKSSTQQQSPTSPSPSTLSVNNAVSPIETITPKLTTLASSPSTSTFTSASPAAHDIAKPITKYPNGHPPNDNHLHAGNEISINDNGDNDDDDEYEGEMVEDIYLYTLTHLHPTTFVPTSSAPSGPSSSSPSVGATATAAGVFSSSTEPALSRQRILSSQEPLAISSSSSPFTKSRPLHLQKNEQSSYSYHHHNHSGVGKVDPGPVHSLHMRPLDIDSLGATPTQPLPLPGQTPLALLSEEDDLPTKPAKKKCSSFAIFRCFLFKK